MRIWFNHWFSTAYHLINMIKADTNNEFYIIGTSTNSSAIYKMTCDEWYSEEKDISASDYIDFCVEFCKEHNVKLGIITVDEGSAQTVCEQMVSSGIEAIWNFAPCKLKVPKGTLVQNENLALSLAHLNNQLSNSN